MATLLDHLHKLGIPLAPSEKRKEFLKDVPNALSAY